MNPVKAYRSLIDAGNRQEIVVPVFIKQAASGGAARVRHIRIPAGMKLHKVEVVADGTLASTNKTVTVTQAYVSAGSAEIFGERMVPMNATDTATFGTTITATTNPALFSATVATTLVPVVAAEHTNYVASGAADETTTINTLRARCEFKRDDIVTCNVPASNDTAVPYYRFILKFIPDCVENETAAAVA